MNFSLGEIAIFAVARTAFGVPHVGKEVTVAMVGPFDPNRAYLFRMKRFTGWMGDYIVETSEGVALKVYAWQLRKRRPPEEPTSLRRLKAEETAS